MRLVGGIQAGDPHTGITVDQSESLLLRSAMMMSSSGATGGGMEGPSSRSERSTAPACRPTCRSGLASGTSLAMVLPWCWISTASPLLTSSRSSVVFLRRSVTDAVMTGNLAAFSSPGKPAVGCGEQPERDRHGGHPRFCSLLRFLTPHPAGLCRKKRKTRQTYRRRFRLHTGSTGSPSAPPRLCRTTLIIRGSAGAAD